MRPRLLLLTLLAAAACEAPRESKSVLAGSNAAGNAVAASAPEAPPPPMPSRAPAAMAAGAREEPQMQERTAMALDATAGFGGAAQAGAPAAPAPAGTSQPAAPSYLIRTGNASIEVDSLEPALAAVRALAARAGGWVANSSISGGKEQRREASLEIKVPAPRFDDVANGLAPIGRVEGVTVSAQDVGEEFVDVTARVANARRLEARLIDLLERRTARLSDMLTVERELARVREEIERYEGRLRYLGARVAVSTFTVLLREPPPLVASAPGEHPIADAARQAGRNFVGVIALLIASTGVLVPVGLVAALAWLGVRRWRRRTAKPSTPATPATGAA